MKVLRVAAENFIISSMVSDSVFLDRILNLYVYFRRDHNMKNSSGLPQLVLRLALGTGFIIPVMDRLGLLGKPGTTGVAWGDWPHFAAYTNTLIPFLNSGLANIAAVAATIAESIFGICLIFGFRIREIGLGAAILTFIFGLCMAITQGIGAPFAYPVFVFTGAGLVLSGIGSYKWSIDNYFTMR